VTKNRSPRTQRTTKFTTNLCHRIVVAQECVQRTPSETQGTLNNNSIACYKKSKNLKMGNFSKLFGTLIAISSFFVCTAQRKTIDQKVDSVLKLMTLDEKIGQMNQYNGDWEATGPITKDGDKQNQIRKGMLGSMLNVTGVEHTKQLQEIAMESRLKIPLLFGQDIIHGYRTIFPIPLAEASSWDTSAMIRPRP